MLSFLTLLVLSNTVCIDKVFSSPTYCNKEEAKFYCSIVRPLETIKNYITQTDIDTDAANIRSNVWYINTTIYLPTGSYLPGISTLPWFLSPIIYIEGNGKLIIQDTGTNEVSIRSFILICDNGEFTITNSTFRADMDYGFQYWLWAADNARLQIIDSTVAMGKETNETINGHWLNYIRMNASCYVNNMTGVDGYWEFATLDNATSHIQNTNAVTEMYISQNAQLLVENFVMMDIFFALCPSESTVILQDLPAVGTIPTLLVSQPNGFEFTAINTYIFAFACELYTGSNVIFNNIPMESNLALGLNIDNETQTDFNISMQVGNPPIFTGFESIYTTVFNNSFVFAYMLWMNKVNVNIMPGTEVGDIYATENTNVYGKELRVINGNNRQQSNSVVMVDDSEIFTFSVVLKDGYLILRNCTFAQGVDIDTHIQNNDGNLWIVDNVYHSLPSDIFIENNGKYWSVNVTNVPYGSHISVDRENGIGIVGNIYEMNNYNNAFDCDVKLVNNVDNNDIVLSNKITENVSNGLLLGGGIAHAIPGEYVIIISFNMDNGKVIDVLHRYITITATTSDPSMMQSMNPTDNPSIYPSYNPSLYATGNSSLYPTVSQTTNVTFANSGNRFGRDGFVVVLFVMLYVST